MLQIFADPFFLVVSGVGLLLSLWAQAKVKSTFSRYSQVGIGAGLSGVEAASAVLRASRLPGMRVERVSGFLSDHYDPRARTLRLSPQVHDGRSVASIAVAAHEAGHSMQHATGHRWLGVRTKIIRFTSIGSRLWSLPFFAGLLLSGAVRGGGGAEGDGGWSLGTVLMALGILLFGLVVVFQLVTLPVELDASRRAKVVLAETGIVRTREEAEGVDKVLDAAAWTYIAAALAGMLQLIYMIYRLQGRRQ